MIGGLGLGCGLGGLGEYFLGGGLSRSGAEVPIEPGGFEAAGRDQDEGVGTEGHEFEGGGGGERGADSDEKTSTLISQNDVAAGEFLGDLGEKEVGCERPSGGGFEIVFRLEASEFKGVPFADGFEGLREGLEFLVCGHNYRCSVRCLFGLGQQGMARPLLEGAFSQHLPVNLFFITQAL